MRVILTEDLDNLGRSGEIVNVKPGYARNFLFPRKVAILADEKNVRVLNHQKRIIDAKRRKLQADAESVKEAIEGLNLSFSRLAGQEGKLFGSVTTKDVTTALADAGINVEIIRLSLDEPLKELGEHKLVIKLPSQVEATLTLSINPEEEAEVEA